MFDSNYFLCGLNFPLIAGNGTLHLFAMVLQNHSRIR